MRTTVSFIVAISVIGLGAAAANASSHAGIWTPAAAVQGRGQPPPMTPPIKPTVKPAPPKPTSKGPPNLGTQLANKPQLVATLQPLLPGGLTVDAAAIGFKNLGQFVAAVHVSHNLGLSFTDLKAKMTGTPPESPGQAIHALDPSANAAKEEKTANAQAQSDLAGGREKGDTRLTERSALEELPEHTALVARLQALLPPGTDVVAASSGFRNLGEFVAAVHVSHDLGISFTQLKADVTGSKPMPLGAAITALKPSVDAPKAQEQARAELGQDLASVNGQK